MGKVKCLVINCNVPNTSMHQLPADLSKRVLWLEQLKHVMSAEIGAKEPSICGVHFEEKCFRDDRKKRVLKPDAIPTKFNLVFPDLECDSNVDDTKLTSDEFTPNLNERNLEKPHLPKLLNDVEIKQERIEEDIDGPGLIVEEPSNEEGNKYKYNSIKFYTENGKAEVCRVCLKPTFDNIKLIKHHQIKSIAYKDMVHFVLPDMNLDLYPDPVMCVGCETLLVHAYEFKKKSVITDEALHKYLSKGKFRKGPVNIIIFPKPSKKHKMNIISDQVVTKAPTKVHTETESETTMDSSSGIQDELLENNDTKELDGNQLTFDTTDNNQAVKSVWGEAPYLCDICGHIFYKLSEYRAHLKGHRTKTETLECFTCDICNMSFKTVNRTRHYSTHEKERNGQCHICGKIVTRQSLRVHLMYHNLNNKKHKCHICNDNKTFFRTQLSVHLKRHREPVKSRVCHICGKSIRSDLKEHLERMHGNQGSYNCVICNKTFGHKRNLKHHFVKIHVRRRERVFENDISQIFDEHTYALKEKLSVVNEEVEGPGIQADVET